MSFLALAAVLGLTDGLVLLNPAKHARPLDLTLGRTAPPRPLDRVQSARLNLERAVALKMEGANRRPPTEYELNRGKAIDVLNWDATRFAEAELNWSIYSDRVQLSDPTGVRARGLASYKRFFQLVRLFRSIMVDDVSVRHWLRVDDANQRIVVCWYSTWKTSMSKEPLQVDAVSYYSLDERGLVEAHEVDRVEINGKRKAPETAWESLQNLVTPNRRPAW